MKIELLFFGQLTDKTGVASAVIDNPGSVEMLKQKLNELYPGLNNVKFTIAINNKMAADNESINNHAQVACMPPFSGG